METSRKERLEEGVREQLARPVASVDALRSLLWHGELSPVLRAEVWKLLLSYT